MLQAIIINDDLDSKIRPGFRTFMALGQLIYSKGTCGPGKRGRKRAYLFSVDSGEAVVDALVLLIHRDELGRILKQQEKYIRPPKS